MLDLLVLLPLSHGQEVSFALFILSHPLPRKAAVFDSRQYLLHSLANVLVDDLGAAGVVAVLGGIADRVAHVAKPALVDEVHDKL